MTSSSSDFTSEPADTQRVMSLLAEFHSFEPEAREKVVLTMKAFDHPHVIDILAALLRSPNSELRCDAAEALLRIDATQTIDIVLPLLNDSDGNVRWNTCGLLHDFGDKRAIASLTRVLLQDSEADVRLMAAWALGEIGDSSALSALRHAAESDNGTDYEGRRVCDAAAESIQDLTAC
jgi:HEAT repeat protein